MPRASRRKSAASRPGSGSSRSVDACAVAAQNRAMALMGKSEVLPHRFIPLSAAAASLKAAAANEAVLARHGVSDLNAVASFIASVVPIYRYSRAMEGPPKVVAPARLRQAVFRDDGRQLHFLDGSPPADRLAVDPAHLEEVMRLLNEGGPTLFIKSRILRQQGRALRSRSDWLRQQSREIRLTARAAFRDHSRGAGVQRP